MHAIETKALTRRFRDTTAVHALNLTVEEGELFALLGVNGAGKTTLIRMLCGLLSPSEGDALVLGHSILREAAQVKRLIGISPQETAVAPHLTVRENLLLICGLHGFSRAESVEKAQAMLHRLHLEEVSRKQANALSGGWMRRLSIAMALISEPRILFLDEPTLGLDVLIRRELWQIIRELKGKSTVVLTTHYLEEAEALSDRIGILAHGQLIALGTEAQLVQQAGVSCFEDAFIALAGKEARP